MSSKNHCCLRSTDPDTTTTDTQQLDEQASQQKRIELELLWVEHLARWHHWLQLMDCPSPDD